MHGVIPFRPENDPDLDEAVDYKSAILMALLPCVALLVASWADGRGMFDATSILRVLQMSGSTMF